MAVGGTGRAEGAAVDLCLGARRHVDVDEVGDDGLAFGECGRALLVGAVGSGESFVRNRVRSRTSSATISPAT